MNKSRTTASVVFAFLLVFNLFSVSTPFVYAENTASKESLETTESDILQGSFEEGAGVQSDLRTQIIEGDTLQGSFEEGVGTQNDLQVQTAGESTLTTLAVATVTTEEQLADALRDPAVTDIEITGDIVITGMGAGSRAPFALVGTKTVSSVSGSTFKLSRGAGFEAEMFSIIGPNNSAPATLTLSNIVLDGAYQGTPGGLIDSLIKVQSFGTLNLNVGAVVQNNAADVDGGGIYNGEGEIIINGGKVINNTSAGTVGGGGIYNNGKLTLVSGSISNNHAPNGRGGGVYNLSSFEQLGGEIANNTALEGAGVSNRAPHFGPDYAEFDMQGGSIANNIAAESGGGIDNYGYFTLSGGTISGNSCTASDSSGGGIVTAGLYKDDPDPNLAADHRTRTTILGGTITNNSAAYGGGICADEVDERTPAPTSAEFITINFSGGTISDNSATTAGGGIYIKKSTGLSRLYLSDNPQMVGNGIYVDGTLESALAISDVLQAGARILVEGSSVSNQMVEGALVANRQTGTGTLTEAEANTFMSLDGTLTGTLSGNSAIWKLTPVPGPDPDPDPDPGPQPVPDPTPDPKPVPDPTSGSTPTLAKTADSSPLILSGILALSSLICLALYAASRKRSSGNDANN